MKSITHHVCPDCGEIFGAGTWPRARCRSNHVHDNTRTIFVALDEVVEALHGYEDKDFAGVHVQHPADFILSRFGGDTADV